MSRADEQFKRDEWLVSRPPYFNKIMVVEFNTGGANYIPVRQTSTRSAAEPAGDAAADSSVSFSSQSLKDTLKQSAAVRPEKVAEANALLNDGNYPSDATLNRLAGFLAQRL
jgi:anti-sigma28 factor (negative regulator of flagellin synthesis)